MTIASSGIINHRQRPVFKDRLSFFQRTTPQFATNRVEQVLIFATVALLPLQEYIPAVGGFSIMYLLFAALAAYVIVKRPDCITKIWLHPLLLAVYVFLCIGFLMELSHPYSSYYEIYQMALTFAGSVFLAALCRDRKALRFAMYGFMASGLIFAVNLLLNYYGALSGSTAIDYREAEGVRAAVFAENPMDYNLNGMAFFTAQGTGVAVALALTTRSRWSRYLFLGVALACFVATFLPMSRSGIAILLGVCASVVVRYGVGRVKTLVIAIIVAAVMVILIPPAVWQRLTFSTAVNESGRMEGRAVVYTAFFHHLPEFVMTGVGAGNFWGEWGRGSQYSKDGRRISGAHNVFFQMTIYWGLPALFGLLVIIWQAYCCLPGRYKYDGLAIGLLCVAVSLSLWSLTNHNLYAKEFSIGIGLLVAAHHWIWPRSALQRQPRRRRDFRPSPEHAL